MLAITRQLKKGTDIQYAAELLKAGEVVAIPTETVYGLAADAFNPEAVLKVFAVKNRPRFNPLIVHIPSLQHIHLATDRLHPVLMVLAERFWPGPLTILSQRSVRIHEVVTAGSDLVAVRVPRHDLTLQLLNLTGFPLAAPSANEFGRVSPTSAQHVIDQLGDKIPYVLDGGTSEVGIESTIVKMEGEKVVVLRPGGISSEQLSEILGYQPEFISHRDTVEAPGMLKSHYAPRIPLIVGDFATLIKDYQGKKVAVLSFHEKKIHPQVIESVVLAPDNNLTTAAKSLFSALHLLEQTDADIIIADKFPEEGLGIAINDRLKRASS